jgi:hypothetical protein
MRKASLLVLTMLLLVAGVAAQQPKPNPNQADDLTSASRAQVEREAQFQNKTCYTMRSYLFQRSEGEAPRLVGMTTCTPGNRFRTYHAGQKPQFGIYPATERCASAAENGRNPAKQR